MVNLYHVHAGHVAELSRVEVYVQQNGRRTDSCMEVYVRPILGRAESLERARQVTGELSYVEVSVRPSGRLIDPCMEVYVRPILGRADFHCYVHVETSGERAVYHVHARQVAELLRVDVYVCPNERRTDPCMEVYVKPIWWRANPLEQAW